MNDLIAFVEARLAEDEQIARAAFPGPWRHNEHPDYRAEWRVDQEGS